ncbi:MAG: type III secretion system inner rod subunit SctI [Paludibacterium sp.]|uniref:type III secretion system inner rod subunit SctI n=1 Tax=Paludibacterium sp. TaxID=1917523 RepID=UPI0025DC4C87|nr:type III secretion system inner rod subunit SctI [Paludibacterium sp.]MBV8047531.1 type III secretion system inner rod subunit SctI [Paludibacterium sp.]MBV8649600.1 type III secretion system inner rod subunit SctI [Paludibacterium sp.]
MTIDPIAPLANARTQPESGVAPPPDPATIERFAAMMAGSDPLSAPSDLLQAQKQLSRTALSTDWTAKVAGLLTQAVNKLVNMQ